MTGCRVLPSSALVAVSVAVIAVRVLMRDRRFTSSFSAHSDLPEQRAVAALRSAGGPFDPPPPDHVDVSNGCQRPSDP
jgi:hypothetical protein